MSADSAFYIMVQSLTSIVFDSSYKSQWLLMCNDHTYVFRSNLMMFLQQLDSDDLIYSGSQLSIRYRGRLVSFASGGAGVVLSRVAAALVVMTWYLICEDAVKTALFDAAHVTDGSIDRYTACASSSTVLLSRFLHYDRSSSSIVVDVSGHGGEGLGCLLVLLRRWLVHGELSSSDEVGLFSHFLKINKVAMPA